MHKPWNVAQHGQQDIDPEVLSESYLEEHTQRWDNYRQEYAEQVGHGNQEGC